MKIQNVDEHLDEAQQKIGYWFGNRALLIQVLTRSSYSADFGGENNEVLEFLGKEVFWLHQVTIIILWQRKGSWWVLCKNESDFTDLKKEMVKNETLAARIDKLEFFKCMYLGKSDIDILNSKKT